MDNQQERFEKKMAWLAGIIEGEGWVSLSKKLTHQKNNTKTINYLPNIGMCNTDLGIMKEVRMLFNYLDLNFRFSTRKDKVGSDGIYRKQRYEISVASARDILTLSKAILPYMIGQKFNRFNKILEFIKIRQIKGKGPKGKYGDEEESIYKELYSYKGKSRSKILNDYTLNMPCA